MNKWWSKLSLKSKLQLPIQLILLALMVLGVCGKLLFDLVVTPDDLFALGSAGAH